MVSKKIHINTITGEKFCKCFASRQNEKDNRLFIFLLSSSSVLGAGLEPAQPLWSQDFKSCVSTIPPSERTLSGRRDSNPRPRPWQGRALPILSYFRKNYL